MSLNSKKRWSGWYQKKDEPSQASIKSMAQEKELSGAGSDSLKKNAKRSSFPKKSSRILRKGNRLEQYHNEFGVRWLLDRFHIYPNSYYNYKKNRKAGYLADKEKKKQQILSIYYEYDRRPGYRRMVIFLRRKGKIILHSDQGSQYTSRAFTEFCKGKGIQQSTSKAGCLYDNSPMESFYGTCLTISVFQTCLAPVTRITLKKSLSFKNLRSSSRVIYFITHLRIFMKIYD